jgi:hypothetical protein
LCGYIIWLKESYVHAWVNFSFSHAVSVYYDALTHTLAPTHTRLSANHGVDRVGGIGQLCADVFCATVVAPARNVF